MMRFMGDVTVMAMVLVLMMVAGLRSNDDDEEVMHVVTLTAMLSLWSPCTSNNQHNKKRAPTLRFALAIASP